MNGQVKTADEKSVNCKYAIMVSDLSPAQTFSRTTRTPRKAATFGKRSNSMRRNPKAEVVKQGWLYKQASSGVKQWNRRWFVLAERCLFYYKDEKEDTVLGSLPLLSFRIGAVETSDNITRKFAFKVCLEVERDDDHLKSPIVFCVQAEHVGTRTYYFSTDSHEEQKEWIRAMNGAAEVHNNQLIHSSYQDTAGLSNTMVTKAPDHQTHLSLNTQSESGGGQAPILDSNNPETQQPSSPRSDQVGTKCDTRQGHETKAAEVQHDRGRSGPEDTAHLHHQPNGWDSQDPHNTVSHNTNSKAKPSQRHSRYLSADKQSQTNIGENHDTKDSQERVTLRRAFVPRTAPERVAQRRSSMAQLQQWVNQRRGMNFHEDLSSPTHYFPVNQGISADYCSYSGGSQYMDEYPVYPAGARPDSICSGSALGAYDRQWTVKEKRRSLRDGSHQLYGPHTPMDSWGPQYYSGMETSMRRLSIQPRSRSVPRSPSSSLGGHYSPVPPNFASPARSTSTRFDQFPGRMDDLIYADPSIYGLRRSLSSPKVPPFHDMYHRELHPTLKLNEIETSKLLGRLCEQNHILKDHEAVVHRLRMDKDNLEEALVITHQEMEFYQNQPLIIEKLQLKKEVHQSQLVNIRGELSQASSALTTARMEFEALESEANAIHGDLWEQLNTGGQNELVRRHIQKEFWRVQDVLEGLHKNKSSRGTDTSKHRVTSGVSGSFSTNSSASPLSSLSLTSPISPYSSMLGCQASPTKQFGPEESVPARPPLPQSYYPLEPCPSFPPSIPPLPFDSTAWLCSLGIDAYLDGEDSHIKKPAFGEQSTIDDVQDQVHDRLSSTNKVGIVPPRTKSPNDELHRSSAGVLKNTGRLPNGTSRERPKSAVFPTEMKSKMSIEEQNERIRRNQSNSMRDKRRSLNLSSGHSPANYRVIRRRLTAHEIDIKDLEVAVRGQGHESPREEIARLKRLHVEPEHSTMNAELMSPDKDVISEHYVDEIDDTPMSPEEQKEKQKKLERIKTLIAKSNLQNIVPLLDGPVDGGAPVSSQQQLLEQEKRIEISCALAAEASRRSRLLSAQCTSSPTTNPSTLGPSSSSADFPSSAAHVMKV